MLFRLLLITSFLLPELLCIAQKSNKTLAKADGLYSEQKYEQAIKLYHKILKSDASNQHAILQTSRSNKQLGNYQQADKYFEQYFYVTSAAEPSVFMEYGDVLMKLGKTSQARTYFSSYNNLVEKNDLRAINYIDAIENYDKYFTDSSFIEVKQSTFSSQGNDNLIAVYENTLFVSSNANNLKSNPLSYILYSAQANNSNSKLEKVDIPGFGKRTFNGITVANESGEFIFTSTSDGQTELYRSFIQDDNRSLSKPEQVDIEGFLENILEITASPTGSFIVFSSETTGGTGGSDLYRCERNSYGYSQPELIQGFVNTMGNESHPYLVNDTMLFFASNGHGGVGGMDIFYVNLNKPSSLPKNLGYPINSRFDEYGLVVFNNGRSGYVVSERNTTQTFADVFSFELIKQRATGEVVDKQTRQNLKNIGVDVKREGEEESKFALADNGRFNVVGVPGETFELTIWRDGYEMETFLVNTSQTAFNGLFEVGIGKFKLLKTDPDEMSTTVADEYFTEIEPLKETPEPTLPKVSTRVIAEPVIEKTIVEQPVQEPEPEVEEIAIPEPIVEDIPIPEPVVDEEPAYSEPVTPETLFRLQIAASRTPLSDSELKAIYSGAKSIFMFTEDNWYKYAIADFDSYYEANQERRLCGVKGAFVVAYRNQSKLKLRSAIEETVAEDLKITDKSTTAKDISGIVNSYEIFFPYNALHVSQSQRQKLADVVQAVHANTGTKVKIIGHTDILGSKLYNYGLAKERAEYIMNYLVEQGISPERISIASSGETNLKKVCNANCTPQVHRQNRRAEVILYN